MRWGLSGGARLAVALHSPRLLRVLLVTALAINQSNQSRGHALACARRADLIRAAALTPLVLIRDSPLTFLGEFAPRSSPAYKCYACALSSAALVGEV